MKKGALYIRVSTHLQDELSPDAQKRLLLDYAEANNISILDEHIFIEKGVSGRKADKRPQFQNMIAQAKQKPAPFNVILVWKFSRFARNQEESIVYKSLLKKQCNVEVISISEPIVEGPFGSLIERVIEWMDEYYSTRLSGEVIRGMTEKALRGGYQSKPPLGYRIAVKGEPPVIVPEEAKIIRLIFEEYVNRNMSTFDLARYLNILGYKTSQNKPFEKRSVEYILQNPTYCGMIRWNRTTNETNKIKDRSKWIISEGLHEAIINKELFERAQERFSSTCSSHSTRPSSTYRHWLSGLLKCPYCGRTMIARTLRRADGRKYVNFVCYGYAKGKCLKSASISSLKLDPIVLAALKEVLGSHKFTFAFKNTAPIRELNENKILNDQLSQITLKESRIKRAYRNGIDTFEEYKKNKFIIEKERANALAQISELKEKLDKEAHDKKFRPQTVNNAYSILSSDRYTSQEKNEILKSIGIHFVYDRESDTLNAYYCLSPYR